MSALEKKTETTFVMVKPDGMVIPGVQRELIQAYRSNGLELVASDVLVPSIDLLERHYEEHTGKPWLPSTIDYIRGEGEEFQRYVNEVLIPRFRVLEQFSGNLVMAWKGPDAINKIRELHGPTNPDAARRESPESVRAKYGGCHGKGLYNIVHASANPDDAKREVQLYFPR